MTHYHRQAIQITTEQKSWLRQLAYATGKSMSQLIREVIDISMKLTEKQKELGLDKTP